MSWATSIDKAELGKQGGGGTPLKIGKFNYEITAAGEVPDKKDPTGKTKQVVFGFSREGTEHKVWFSPESSNETVSKIAGEQLGAIAKAAGLKGVLKPERLKLLIGKSLSLDCYENKKGYVTIGGIDVVDEEDGLEEEVEEQEETTEEAEEETETEAEEETPTPKGKRKQPWE